MMNDMHTYVSFDCTDKGLKVKVFVDATQAEKFDCSGAPKYEKTATWGECQKYEGSSIIVTNPQDSNVLSPAGATAIKAASIAFIALIGSQF